jgi:hypothetical protein
VRRGSLARAALLPWDDLPFDSRVTFSQNREPCALESFLCLLRKHALDPDRLPCHPGTVFGTLVTPLGVRAHALPTCYQTPT